ncbi:9119_t:CDS:2 [Ambispora leptoticha]|uniref:9119_t:CDS:1 n=1 Tax=Ambispora leptoticha TaxID=144679 RepID=A0A9N9EWI8_9GLOM|nr:9119_t:CDS:2 [Ambispora leptoticha]
MLSKRTKQQSTIDYQPQDSAANQQKFGLDNTSLHNGVPLVTNTENIDECD